MKFKHSTYEVIYDRFWDMYVTPLDSMIREASKGSNTFEKNISSITLIKKLSREIRQMLKCLDNPLITFEDPYSLRQYRQNLVDKSFGYFSDYMRIYPQHIELTSNLMRDLGIKRNTDNVVWLKAAS